METIVSVGDSRPTEVHCGYVGRMRRKLTVLFALLTLATAGACGDDAGTVDSGDQDDSSEAGEQLTQEEFIERGDAVCGELDVALGLIESPADETDFARYLKDIRGPAEAARESWELLVPPADGEEVHQAVLGQLTSGLEAVNGAITAAESGDTVTAEDLLAEADRAGDLVDAKTQAYGFQECGKDDADEGAGAEGGGSGGDESSGESSDMEPLPEQPDPEPNDPPRDDEPLPEEPDPEPVDPEPNG